MPDSTVSSSALTVEILRREFPGYRIVREVGHGAMGVVFEAQQAGLGRRVAVKVLPPNLSHRERTVKRFVREAEAMGRLAHPGIVDVFEVGSRHELYYFSMKFVEGPPLDRVLRAGPLAVDDVVRVGLQVADALAHAHSRGVLHRDVKPANLLRDGERVVLTDFGLARPIDSADGGSMTESGDLVGTPLYMAPEQISGDAERVDGRADVWGLGVTLYELLAGRTPFTGPNAQGILHAILHRDPPLLRKLRDDVPRDLEAVVHKCLEKDPGRRYTTAAALREDLEAVRDGGSVSATPPRPWDPLARWVRRHPAEATIMSAIAVAAVVALTYWRLTTRQLQDVSAQRDVAQAERTEALYTVDDYVQQKRETWARYELVQVREQAARATTDPERADAEERLIDILDEIPVALHPDIAAEAIEMLARWNHERGVDDQQALEGLEHLADLADLSRDLRLFVRAAALSGQGRLIEALALHQERSRLTPSAPAPLLDAARVQHRMAVEAGERVREARSRAHLAGALKLLARAIALAVEVDDPAALQRILTERARCLLDLGDPASALADLDQVLARDPTDFEAFSTRLACERALRHTTAEQRASAPQPRTPTPAAAQPASAEAEPVEEVPALSIEKLLPGRVELTEDLQSAGRGLQSIYRGLHQLLQSAPEPEPEPDGETPQAPGPQGGG